MRRYLSIGLLAAAALYAQDRGDTSDLAILGSIKTEAFDNSQVMDTLEYLTDIYGPRLTASPEFRQAADWAVQRLTSYGIENVHMEKWGPFGRSWSLKQASLEMLEPRYAPLDAVPLAWSQRTSGPVIGEILLAPLGAPGPPSPDPKVLEQDLNKYMVEWKGKLRGKIVMLSRQINLPDDTQPRFARYTEKELSDLLTAPAPTAKLSDFSDLKFPDDPQEVGRYMGTLPDWMREWLGLQRQEITARFTKFLADEGALAVLRSTAGSRDGLLIATDAGAHQAKYTMSPPAFSVDAEQYNRILRVVGKKTPVKLRVNLQADYSEADQDSVNIIGEIPGGAKPDEVVMIGAHFDSWQSGTGATDNAAGSAVMMEVMRVLKALHLKLDRTVRIALWSGEEQGLLGSKAYVKAHFGDPETMRLQPEHAKLSGYFNLDNGSGKIRGVYLQGNDAMRPVFERWLAPFRDEGVTTISIRNTGGTDHLSFDAVGLPGFQFIQDPLEYETVTHHTTMDTYDHAKAADLMQATAVIAMLVYDTANRPDLLPRKALPKPRPHHEAPAAGFQ